MSLAFELQVGIRQLNVATSSPFIFSKGLSVIVLLCLSFSSVVTGAVQLIEATDPIRNFLKSKYGRRKDWLQELSMLKVWSTMEKEYVEK